jgi:hypothetical protein
VLEGSASFHPENGIFLRHGPVRCLHNDSRFESSLRHTLNIVSLRFYTVIYVHRTYATASRTSHQRETTATLLCQSAKKCCNHRAVYSGYVKLLLDPLVINVFPHDFSTNCVYYRADHYTSCQCTLSGAALLGAASEVDRAASAATTMSVVAAGGGLTQSDLCVGQCARWCAGPQ